MSWFKIGIILFLLPLLLIEDVFGQKGEDVLLDRKISVRLSDATLQYSLGTLVQQYGIAVGLEKSPDHKDLSSINVDVTGESLRNILDLIVAQDGNYEWSVATGVINFTPRRKRDDFLKLFLDLRISQIDFPMDKENDAFSLRKRIFELAEVKVLLTSKRIDEAGILYHSPSSQPMFAKNNGDLTSSNITIKEFLNKIVRCSDHKTWVVEMVGKDRDKLLISF